MMNYIARQRSMRNGRGARLQAIIFLVMAAIYPSQVWSEVSARGSAAFFGTVVSVNEDLSVNIRIGDPVGSKDEQFIISTGKPEQADLETLSVVLQGRDVFCFPIGYELSFKNYQVAECYVKIPNFPGYFSKTEFIPVSRKLYNLMN